MWEARLVVAAGRLLQSYAGAVPLPALDVDRYCVTVVIDDEVHAVQGERLCASGATQESLVVP